MDHPKYNKVGDESGVAKKNSSEQYDFLEAIASLEVTSFSHSLTFF